MRNTCYTENMKNEHKLTGGNVIKYVLYTEWRNNLDALVSSHFDGYTIAGAKGIWKGHKESSAIIVIMTEAQVPEKIGKLVKAIKLANEQEAVMVETQTAEVAFI